MSEVKDVISKEIEQIKREKLADKYVTALKKAKFINELKNGLGSEIKANSNKVKIIKKPWTLRFTVWLKKIFTKF